jgi:hypothetical protein
MLVTIVILSSVLPEGRRGDRISLILAQEHEEQSDDESTALIFGYP